MSGDRAFSIIEIIVVLVIIGIFITMAFSNQAGFMEKNRGKNAENNLGAIYNAEKRYRLSNNEYCACADVPEINEKLNLLIDDPYFTYSITAADDTFSVEAFRNEKGRGPCAGKTMSITSENSSPQKECEAWR